VLGATGNRPKASKSVAVIAAAIQSGRTVRDLVEPRKRVAAYDQMPHISYLPFESVDSDLQAIMHEYDDELGGSDFVRVFAHSPDVFKSFIRFYFPLITETRGSVDMKLTELARLKVAELNGCHL
jgi:hypothetical protein